MRIRRRSLLAVATFPLLADEREDALRILEPLVAALSDGRSEPFLAAVDAGMPEYGVLREYLESLVRQAEVTSSVTLIEAGQDRFDVDWIMSLRARHDSARIERRRERVRVELARKKIRNIGPVAFFAPMGATL